MGQINATVTCFKGITTKNNNIISFNAPFKAIKSINNKLCNFMVVTQICLMDNEITLDFKVILTKCSEDISYDLDSFCIKKEESSKISKEYTRITNINNLSIPYGTGEYAIEILVKDHKDEEYTIQSMTKLEIY